MSKPRCLNPNCPSKGRITRGLCLTCYHAANHLVTTGQTTWAQLETNGRCLPPTPNSRKGWLLSIPTPTPEKQTK